MTFRSSTLRSCAKATPPVMRSSAVQIWRSAQSVGRYRRFWVAEHHNNEAVASAATALVISQSCRRRRQISDVRSGRHHVAERTRPLVVRERKVPCSAEQFGTLDALYPGRIDLGLGRASGTDEAGEAAIGRPGRRERFAEDVSELLGLLGPSTPDQAVRAIPGTGSEASVWILGSTTNGAELAARFGSALCLRGSFSSRQLGRSARGLSSWIQTLGSARSTTSNRYGERHRGGNRCGGAVSRVLDSELALGIVRNAPKKLRPPRPNVEADWSETDKAMVNALRTRAQVGSRATVREGLRALIAEAGVDELMFFSTVHGTEARLEILRDARRNREDILGNFVCSCHAMRKIEPWPAWIGSPRTGLSIIVA